MYTHTHVFSQLKGLVKKGCVCVYIYICMHIHIHKYTYTSTNTRVYSQFQGLLKKGSEDVLTNLQQGHHTLVRDSYTQFVTHNTYRSRGHLRRGSKDMSGTDGRAMILSAFTPVCDMSHLLCESRTMYVSHELCMCDTNYVNEGHANLCRDPWMCEMSNPLVCVWVTNYVYETRTMWMSVMNICAMTLCVRWETHCCVCKSRTMWGRAMILSVLTHVCVLRYPLYDSWSMYMSPELCMWFTNYVGEGQESTLCRDPWEGSELPTMRVTNYVYESRTMCMSHELCGWEPWYFVFWPAYVFWVTNMCTWVTNYVWESPDRGIRESRTMCMRAKILYSHMHVSYELCICTYTHI